MERLSNIIRTAQRSHSTADQRLPQHLSAQGRRQPPAARRPLTEQNALPKPGNRTSEVYQARSTPASRLPEAIDEDWEETNSASARSSLTRPLHNRNRSGQLTRYSEQPPQGDYYEEGEISGLPQAESPEDWGDDTAGMRYGDWESEPGYRYPHDYQPESSYIPPTPRLTREPLTHAPETNPGVQRLPQAHLHSRSNSANTRELYRVSPENVRSAILRDSREGRLPVPAADAQVTPIVPGQRTTQPLKPQQMSRLQTELQARTLSRTPQPEETTRPTVYIPAPYINPVETCPVCKGAGYLRQDVPFGHPSFGKPVQCECKRKGLQAKRRLDLQEKSNLRELTERRFENFNPNVSQPVLRAFQIARRYAQEPDGWLIFRGKVGCGKTHLAAAIANQYMERGVAVLFSTVSDLLDHLRATFMPSSDIVYDQLFSQMREAALLVLDDLGAQQSTPWANEKLFQLLNYRYNLKIPTVITTNVTAGIIEERVRSRMQDNSLVTLVELEWAGDYRPKNPRREV